MELKDFIAASLKGIDEGLEIASSTNRGYRVLPLRKSESRGGVSFDIAVVTSKNEEATNKGDVKTQIVTVLSAEIDHTNKKTDASQTTSRIAFTLDVTGRRDSREVE